ncbi:DUF2884 family protein [Rhodanobacter caeni]|uniref:DUF2884 domain-containing protein n=1 Tax=Rhodanobacter caeni TaxID=657654 RepID=A0ABN0UH53_9GAMM
MRLRLLVLPCALLAATSLSAQEWAATCHASSSYDVTLKPASILFDRPSPAPFHVEMQQGALRTDGNAVHLNAEQQDRLTVFERELRALAPRVRTVAQHGLDLAVQALQDETRTMSLGADTRAELDRRLAAHAATFRQRIAASNSTHDWQADVVDQYANQIAADVLPLLANDLGQQALDAAMRGDLQTASRLRDQATGLASGLRPRLEQRMQALQPQIAALCPAITRLADLQQGLHGSKGHPLNLLYVGQ